MDTSFNSGDLARLGNAWANTSSISRGSFLSKSRASMSAPVIRTRGRSDIIPSRPNKRIFAKVSQEVVQPSLRRTLAKNIKGIGFIMPGNPFADRPRVLKHEFAFDMASVIGVRTVCCTLWRHGNSTYIDEDVNVLSPALMSGTRTIDGVDLYTAIRKAGEGPYDELIPPTTLYSSTSLWDLEAASWNANGMKVFVDSSASAPGPVPNPVPAGYVPALPNNVNPVVSSLQCYRDYIPQTDHTKGTPFPNVDHAPISFGVQTQSRPPFMVNLGAGSVVFNCQNKLPTNAEIEFIVYQIRDIQKNYSVDSFTGWIESQCLYSSQSSIARTQGPKLTSEATGSGGLGIAEYDSVNNPNYKLLAVYPKYQSEPSPLIEKDRIKFVLQGGAFKTLSFGLPAQIYDSQKNREATGDPFADEVSANALYSLQTYAIVVAVNGVVMPTFTYPVTNNSNTATSADHNNNSIVDRRHCPSSVLFTGSYTEHPRPCLATPQLGVYNNFPMLQETTVDDANFALTSGLVATMPVSVASGNTVVFKGIGDTLIGQDTND